MHKVDIPQAVVDRVVVRHGREHVHADMVPGKTALVVVDMQNAFMLPGVAHAPCLTAQEIVPNINRLAGAVRDTGGTVVWIKTAYTDDTLENWSTLYDMLGAVVASVLSATAGELDVALVLDAELRVEETACGLSFLLLPSADGVAEVLSRLALNPVPDPVPPHPVRRR